MLDQKVREVSETLARAVGRRTFLQRAGGTIFAGVATLAAGHALSGTASASRAPGGAPQPIPTTPSCSPPGPYCNTGGGILSGCQGAHCFQHLYNGQVYQCRVYYQYYQAGCWTTAAGSGYWTCCDCACGTPQVATCGCAQFSGTPSPSPSGGA